jgi:hypothetical protein
MIRLGFLKTCKWRKSYLLKPADYRYCSSKKQEEEIGSVYDDFTE